MLRLALAFAVAAVLVASTSAGCSDQAKFAGERDYVLYLRGDPSISVADNDVTINIDSQGADGRQMNSAKIGLEGGPISTGLNVAYFCHDFDEGTGTDFDDRMTLTVSFPTFVAAASTTPGGDADPSDFATPGSWDESGSGAFSTDAHQTWVRTVELKFEEKIQITRNEAMITVDRSITEEFLFFVSAPTQITFKDADLIEIFATPNFNILLTGFEVEFGNFDTSTITNTEGGGTSTNTNPSTDAIDTTYTVTMTTIIQQPFQITSFGINHVLDSGISSGSMLSETQTAATTITIAGANVVMAGDVKYNKQAWTFTFALDTCGENDEVDFTVVVGCNDAQLAAGDPDDTCPIANDGTNDGTMTNNWDDTDAGSFTMQFAELCSFEGAYAKPFTVSVKTWDSTFGCTIETPTDTDDFVTGDTVCFRGSVTTDTPDITVDTLTCDSVDPGTTPTGPAEATLTPVTTGTGFNGASDTCEYTVGQGTGNTDTSTEYDFNIQFTVTYVTTTPINEERLRSKRRSLLTTETTTASTTLQISANSNQAAGVGVGVGGVTGTSSGSSLGVVVGAIMGAAVLITLAVFVGVVIVLRKSPSDDRSRSNARYNAGGAPEVTPIVIQLNGGNNGAKKTKAAASRPMARVVPDESSAEADNMTSSTAAYSSAESSSAADYSSTAASTDYVSSSYV